MLDLHTARGYREILPPFMVNRSIFGTGQFPKFVDLFHCRTALRPGSFRARPLLIPTAEVPVTNFSATRPSTPHSCRSLLAYTPCFRSEAGSYGKDTRGLIRQHQFQKVELVKFARPETPTTSTSSWWPTPRRS